MLAERAEQQRVVKIRLGRAAFAGPGRGDGRGGHVEQEGLAGQAGGGSVGLGFAIPVDLAMPTLAVVVTLQIVQRWMNFAIANPARQVFFTVIGREEKYKAKNLIDVVVYRGSDALYGWVFDGLRLVSLAQQACARAWSVWEGKTIRLLPRLLSGRLDLAFVRPPERPDRRLEFTLLLHETAVVVSFAIRSSSAIPADS